MASLFRTPLLKRSKTKALKVLNRGSSCVSANFCVVSGILAFNSVLLRRVFCGLTSEAPPLSMLSSERFSLTFHLYRFPKNPSFSDLVPLDWRICIDVRSIVVCFMFARACLAYKWVCFVPASTCISMELEGMCRIVSRSCMWASCACLRMFVHVARVSCRTVRAYNSLSHDSVKILQFTQARRGLT